MIRVLGKDIETNVIGVLQSCKDQEEYPDSVINGSPDFLLSEFRLFGPAIQQLIQ
jgi:hypothetical protein